MTGSPPTDKIQQWFLDHYHSAELGMKVSLIGSVDEIVDKLGPLAEEGLDMIMFNPVYNLIEHAQVIAEQRCAPALAAPALTLNDTFAQLSFFPKGGAFRSP